MKASHTFSSLLLAASAHATLPCTPSSFTSLLPANASLAFAISIAASATFQVPLSDIAYPTSPTSLQALCAIQVNVTSSNSSAFSFGLFLPSDWNSRFLAVGNGGFAGGINWLDMGAGVGYGFAAMSTDTGHNASTADGTWALNEPEKLIDWGYRAMHGSVVLAKEIVNAYYSASPKYSYYSGCSTGGRQGLKEVQMYPSDFDGVLAGAPAWWTKHLQPWTVKLGNYNLPVNSSGHIPVSLFSTIEAEVRRQCDPQDGVVDNIISDPWGCNLYLEALLCTASETPSTSPATYGNTSAINPINSTACLTSDQLSTLYQIYSPYIDTNQTFVFPPLLPGSEAQWEVLLGGSAPNPLGTEYVQDFLLNDPTWSPTDFDYSIVQLADRLDPGDATADNFDLSPFEAKGGKLLMYHGESDGLIATGSSPYFYNHVLRTLGPKGIDLDNFYRFFLVPGMQHCTGTPPDVQAPWYFAGANQAGAINSSLHSVPGFEDGKHDILLALMDWVEKGVAPEKVVATRFFNDTPSMGVQRQRPLCVYPQQARYMGGDVDRAESWRCEYLYK